MHTLYKGFCFLLRISFRIHLFLSMALRLALIYYGQLHDELSEMPYTDIDYRVVTDGSRQILVGHSPFERHTYRYSPMLAYIQLPNIWLHPAIGKVIYASFDIFVALLIYDLILHELQSQYRKAVQSLLNKIGKICSISSTQERCRETNVYSRSEKVACASACLWLYNPLTAVISTRGNGDSFSSFFVVVTVYLLSKSESVSRRGRHWLVFSAGLAHGFAIHLRLYPVLFSLAYYLCLSKQLLRCPRDFLNQLLFPSTQQLLFILSTLLGFCTLTGFFYSVYGWRYIYEAYLYHFLRKDVRHNFSVYFLAQYLGCNSVTENVLIEKVFIMAPQLFLLIYLSLGFGQFRQTLPFCVFSMAFITVTFNSVVTSQYFVWYLALLPLCLNNLQSVTAQKFFLYFIMWLLAQGLWLLSAYLLEFKNWNTFYWIGGQSILFFSVNNLLLVCLIQYYSFTSFRINLKKLI